MAGNVGRADLSVTVLPIRLVLASLRTQHKPVVASILLRHLAFPTTKNRFFSYSDNGQEISIVMSVKELSAFPEKSLSVSPDVWRAIQIAEGSFGYTETGIVNSISSPLALAGVSIMDLSTFETDYVLVKETEVTKAINILHSHFAVLTEGVDDFESEETKDCTELLARYFQDPDPGPCTSGPMKVRVLPHSLFLGKLYRDGGEKNILAAIEAAFCSNTTGGLFSFTETEYEVSVIIDEAVKDLFDTTEMTFYPVKWRALYIDEGPLGFATPGIVAGLCGPLANAKISLFYLSMFSTDVTLVEDSTLQQAIAELDQKFRFVGDDDGAENAAAS